MMAGMRNTLAALVLPLVLAACGGGGEKEETPTTITSLTDDMGCQGFEFDPDIMGVNVAGSCQIDGEDVFVYTYESSEQQSAIREVSRMGGGVWVAGELFDVQAPSEEIAERIAEDTGGEVE